MSDFARRDVLAGLVVVVCGATFAWGAAQLKTGTITNMGGGYFPLIVAGLTVVFGVAIALRAFLAGQGRGAVADEEERGPVHVPIAWRATIAVMAGIAMFALCMNWFGFIPAVFFCVFLSAFGDPDARPMEALLLAAVTAVTTWALFVYGLEIYAPAFKWAL